MPRHTIHQTLGAALLGLTLLGGSVAAQPAPKHHSKLKGAVAGAMVGHAAGHHAKLGAAAGALVQHHRNSKLAKKGS
jgi:hypothetical protein